MEEIQQNILDPKAKKNKILKTISIVCICTICALIIIALVTDVILVGKQFGTFIIGCVFCGVVLAFLTVVSIFLCALVVGIYLFKQDGFWPLKVSTDMFKSVLKELTFDAQTITTFTIIRIILISICVIVAITSIVVLILNKRKKGEILTKEMRSISTVATTALVLAIIGALVSLALMLIIRA